jgi:hypothetical protein
MKQQYPATKLVNAPGYNRSTIVTEASPFTLAVLGFLKLQGR